MVKASLRLAFSLLLTAVSGCGSKETIAPPSASPDLSITLTPWVNPRQDIDRFFKPGSQPQREKLIFSGARQELSAALGRPLEPSDGLLVIYNIYDGASLDGIIVPQRLKGAYGAIEAIVFLNPAGHILAVQLQKYRGPDSARQELETRLLPAFAGLRAGGKTDLPAAAWSPDSRDDARLIEEAILGLLQKIRLAEANPNVLRQKAVPVESAHSH